MFYSNSKKSGFFNWAILCLVFVFLFFFVAGSSTSFACSKKCKAKISAQKCGSESEATSENPGASSEHSQATSTSQSAEMSAQGSQETVAPATPKFSIKEKYTCPMHPEVMKGKAGKCPKCGMNLEKKEFYEVYACDMEGCPYMSEKGGKCSCGMKLKKKLISKGEYQKMAQPQMTYVCPMHPEVTSDKPGNCPKCGMKLEMKRPVSKE